MESEAFDLAAHSKGITCCGCPNGWLANRLLLDRMSLVSDTGCLYRLAFIVFIFITLHPATRPAVRHQW